MTEARIILLRTQDEAQEPFAAFRSTNIPQLGEIIVLPDREGSEWEVIGITRVVPEKDPEFFQVSIVPND